LDRPSRANRRASRTRSIRRRRRSGCSEGVDVLIVKPAIQEVPQTKKEMIITSYMDHPVGQFGAAYFAALHPAPRCGLFTHVLYEKNEFIERIRSDGARLLPPEG